MALIKPPRANSAEVIATTSRVIQACCTLRSVKNRLTVVTMPPTMMPRTMPPTTKPDRITNGDIGDTSISSMEC